jgi:hypothetical protein
MCGGEHNPARFRPARLGGIAGGSFFSHAYGMTRGPDSPRAWRHLPKIGFSKFDRARMRDLAQKNRQGAISAAELEELDNSIAAGDHG